MISFVVNHHELELNEIIKLMVGRAPISNEKIHLRPHVIRYLLRQLYEQINTSELHSNNRLVLRSTRQFSTDNENKVNEILRDKAFHVRRETRV